MTELTRSQAAASGCDRAPAAVTFAAAAPPGAPPSGSPHCSASMRAGKDATATARSCIASSTRPACRFAQCASFKIT